MNNASQFLLPPLPVDGDPSSVPTYALVVLNQRLPRLSLFSGSTTILVEVLACGAFCRVEAFEFRQSLKIVCENYVTASIGKIYILFYAKCRKPQDYIEALCQKLEKLLKDLFSLYNKENPQASNDKQNTLSPPVEVEEQESDLFAEYADPEDSSSISALVASSSFKGAEIQKFNLVSKVQKLLHEMPARYHQGSAPCHCLGLDLQNNSLGEFVVILRWQPRLIDNRDSDASL
ncbi:hypothetical protein J5N97_013271 [Dioscorea zingiberensis]|uniref:Uncharacterized protein n=1 Tax=Dioscorea zingiberensis TaxID=325984 RepID=A0A9D5CRW3_9LILI|nr:hypothetical protein J5N97_013271 [Dioscorea zingiberensis]